MFKIFYLIISQFLLFCVINANEINFAIQAETDLERNIESSLEVSLEAFLTKGGTLIRLDQNTKPFQLLPNDVVFPSCSGGNNRSQVLWGILRAYDDKIHLMKPHATRYGFDPYNGLVNWHRTKNRTKTDEFAQLFNFPKSEKMGWELFANWFSKVQITDEERDYLIAYFNQNYYCPILPEGARRVYITFAQNAHIHMYRLSQSNESLENVFLLFFPLEDTLAKPLPEWETYARSVKAYSNFGEILKSHLDFTQLN